MRPYPLSLILVLLGCSRMAGEQPESSDWLQEPAYLIRGEERPNWAPGWVAVIRGGRILLDSPTSAGWYAVDAPVPRNEGGRQILAAGAITLVFEDGACVLPAYRSVLPDRIRLESDGGRFEGCGGPRPPAESMDGTVWELVRIGDETTPESRSPAATLIFARERGLGGTLACNDGGIRTTWTENGGFVPHGGAFEQTAMGCNQPEAEVFGMRFWSGLIRAQTWRREGDRLLITLSDGSEAELRRLL